MNTSILGAALVAALFPAHNATLAPAWHHDYRTAREVGSREHKPLVVVIGSGKTDWANLAKPAEQDESINQTLRSSYVCLFVDTDTTEGQKLAREFDMPGPGVVISTRSGEVEAYRKAGEVPAGELAKELVNNANDAYVTRKMAPPPVAAPVQPTYFQPVFGGMGGGFGGSCPSCRR
ncbi:MAG TPA: hypothetical protein VGF55_34290 [Gemmataceae bacterium]|jgi:hypothetical protein